MKLKAFAVRNKVYERIEGVFVSPTAGLAIRDNSPFLAKVSPHFIEDLELCEIGVFSDDGSVFEPLSKMVLHSWDEWKEPEAPAVPLSLDQAKEFSSTPVFNQRQEQD